MKKNLKIAITVFSLSPFYFILATKVAAVCPVCTIAVGAGVGLSRFLGIDDTITGIWVGGFIFSSGFLLAKWLKRKIKKEIKINYLRIFSFLLETFLIFIPLHFSKILWHPFNTILGIDKLIFGTAIGFLSFLASVWLDKKIRKIKGKQLFNYQKIVLPVVTLTIISLIFYFLTLK